MVDERDVSSFMQLGFTKVPNQIILAPGRVGLVYFDAAANQYMRWDGVNWVMTILNSRSVQGRFSRLLRGLNPTARNV